jgi:uncharacterized protein YutE (UPF0331/DUF86 family)
LAELQPLKARARSDSDKDPYLRDIVERNLEIAAKCCIDVSNRIISLEAAQKPIDYYDVILRTGGLEIPLADLTRQSGPLAGFCDTLVHEYLADDWDQVFQALHHLTWKNWSGFPSASGAGWRTEYSQRTISPPRFMAPRQLCSLVR